MSRYKKSNVSFKTILTAMIAITLVGGMMSNLCFAQAVSGALPSPTNAPAATAPASSGDITGAELYSIHCNRCHPERYPTERTAANWKTINLHMQVRANSPPAQARLILKYLQDTSGR